MNGPTRAAFAAWLAIPQEDRGGVVTLLRTRSDVGAASRLIAEAAAAKSTSAARRIVHQKIRDAERVNRACAAAAELLASVEPGDGAPRPALHPWAAVASLGLTRRASGALLNAGLTQIRDLTNRTAGDLLAIHGFGVGCLSEVETALAAHGLRLAGGAS